MVKKLAVRAGLDPANYAGHSLRAGHATSAAVAGAAEPGTGGQGSPPMQRRELLVDVGPGRESRRFPLSDSLSGCAGWALPAPPLPFRQQVEIHVCDLIKDLLHLHKSLQGFLNFWPQLRGDDYLA